ncbi:hypothetical protein [Mammaliicoccus sciuri]|uniref:hypothetical protein n=1 Tax=Mammaliicoccus sciuri TaxID=1296 RepID=UPI001950EEAD|nr:hypothetical protein [Mammaliicoccus sciuri]
MPTIKRKVEMNLGELLCWAIDNKEQARFRDISSKSMRVRFNDNAKPEIIFDKLFLPIEQTFKVEIEEPITEDTVIPKILVKSNYNEMAQEHYDSKINQFVYQYTKAIYIVNDDLTMTLIWTKEKGLVK